MAAYAATEVDYSASKLGRSSQKVSLDRDSNHFSGVDRDERSPSASPYKIDQGYLSHHQQWLFREQKL